MRSEPAQLWLRMSHPFYSPLMLALNKGYIDIARVIWSSAKNVKVEEKERRDGGGYKELHVAAEAKSNSVDACKFVLDEIKADGMQCNALN